MSNIVIMKSKPIVDAEKPKLKEEVTHLNKISRNPVSLIIVTTNTDDASKVYVRNKQKLCEELGIKCAIIGPDDIKTGYEECFKGNKLYDKISGIKHKENYKYISDIIADYFDLTFIPDNSSYRYSCILQLPIDEKSKNDINLFERLSKHIWDYRLDADKFGYESVLNLYLGRNNSKSEIDEHNYLPCTVQGIIDILDYYKIQVEGKHVVIIGRSNIVGKPTALALLNKNATVTICHSKTENLKDITKSADIIISAIGKPKFVTTEFISEKTEAIIDVGINRDENNKLCGDCDYNNIVEYWNSLNSDKTKYITPVPGGIGPLTVLNLMKNVISLHKFHNPDLIEK